MDRDSLEPPLRELLDREAIRDLANRYAHCVWTKDVQAIADLFAKDGVMDTGEGRPIAGRTALLKVYERVFAGTSDFLPFVHNHLIALGGDSATGVCYLDLRATSEGKSMVGAGRYDDRYARVAGEWKFASRRLTMRWLVPLEEGWAGAEPPSLTREASRGTPAERD